MNYKDIDSGLLSQKEAAGYLGISYRKLRDLVRRGEIVQMRFRRRILLDPMDLRDYVLTQRLKAYKGP